MDGGVCGDGCVCVCVSDDWSVMREGVSIVGVLCGGDGKERTQEVKKTRSGKGKRVRHPQA